MLASTRSPVARAATRPPVSYGRDIRPILSDKCFRCHGPDADSREAELRLDTREGITGESRRPRQAGRERSSSRASSATMTTSGCRRPIRICRSPPSRRSCCGVGSPRAPTFTEHWAFQPLPEKVDVPQVHDASWPREPLDRFVLARLEAEKLRPTPAADAAALAAPRDARPDRPAADGRRMPRVRRSGRRRTSMRPTTPPSTACWPAPRSANTWPSPGSMRPATPTPTAINRINSTRSGRIAIGSSAHSTTICRTTSSSPGNSPATCWRTPTRDQILATAFNRLHRLTNEGGSIAEEWLARRTRPTASTRSARRSWA